MNLALWYEITSQLWTFTINYLKMCQYNATRTITIHNKWTSIKMQSPSNSHLQEPLSISHLDSKQPVNSLLPSVLNPNLFYTSPISLYAEMPNQSNSKYTKMQHNWEKNNLQVQFVHKHMTYTYTYIYIEYTEIEVLIFYLRRAPQLQMRWSNNKQQAIEDFEVNDLLGSWTKTGFQRDHLWPSVCHIHFRSSNLYMYINNYVYVE